MSDQSPQPQSHQHPSHEHPSHEHPSHEHRHQHGPQLVQGVGRFRWYDLVNWWARIPAAYRTVVGRMALAPGERVLEVGCGTGNLLLQVARAERVTAIGLDPDGRALRTLRRKADRAHVAVTTDIGTAATLPYADHSVDRALSALAFHHVLPDARTAALAEIVRVLVPGGRLELVDLDAGASAGDTPRRIARHHHVEQDLPGLLRAAGFTVTVHPPLETRFGRLQHLTGRTPG